MINVKRIGHLLLNVSNLTSSITFYRDLLGLELVELNVEGRRKMAFLTLGEYGHNIDLLEISDGDVLSSDTSTLHHIAFQVETYVDLREAYFHFSDQQLKVFKATDHHTQKSIYVKDPDGNIVEIYHELENALQIFREGRNDEDKALVFKR